MSRRRRARAGADEADATSARQPVPDFAAGLPAAAALPSRPLAGRRLGVVTQARGASPGVAAALDAALAHLERLGAEVGEVRKLSCGRVRVFLRVRV